MKVEYTKEELSNIIETVRNAKHTDDLPIHNWARAAKVLDDVAASRLELLKRLEWTTGTGDESTCEICKGHDPSERHTTVLAFPELAEMNWGHADGCKLAEELGDD